MKKTMLILLVLVMVLGLCACGDGGKPTADQLAGSWVSEDRASGERAEVNGIVVEESTYDNYTMTIYEDGSYTDSYDYTITEYDYTVSGYTVGKTRTTSGTQAGSGYWEIQGNTVIFTPKDGDVVKMTYKDGTLKGPQSDGYTYTRLD